MSSVGFRAGSNRPWFVPHSTFGLALVVGLATWRVSAPWGIVSCLVIGLGWLMWTFFDMRMGTGALLRFPDRGDVIPLPTGEQYGTVRGRIIATGEVLTPPLPVDGPVAAWSVDMLDLDVGVWLTLSSRTPLLLENEHGVRFCVELGWQWLAITSQQVPIATTSPCPRKKNCVGSSPTRTVTTSSIFASTSFVVSTACASPCSSRISGSR